MDSQNFTKECCFYVSEFHLVTMLLPHINKSINEQINVITILEENIEDKVQILLDKINIKNKEKILNIGWNKKSIENINLKELFSNNQNIEIIVLGNVDYINYVNNILEDNIENNNVKIINCFNIADIKNIKDILSIHDKVLNTSGEKTVEEYTENIK